MHYLRSCLLLLVTAHVKVCRLAYDKFKFKEHHAKMWENIAEVKRYSRPTVPTLLCPAV